MQNLNKLLLRQIQKFLGGPDKVPENYYAFLRAINESYNHYEKDHHLLERSIELSSEEMIGLNEQLKKETEDLKKAQEELKATEMIRLEKRLDEERIKKLQEITEAVMEVQEQERSILAAELHDNINQILGTSRLYLDTAINNEELRLNLIKDSKGFIDTAIQEIRTLCKSLVPPTLLQASLVSALDEMLHNIRQVNKMQINADWESIDESKMSEKLKLTIFRIIQEQLNNIFKHANATSVTIDLYQSSEGIQLSIKDDGVGFDIKQKSKGIGLQNIFNRTNLFNGEVVIKSQPHAGCELLIAFHDRAKNSQLKIAAGQEALS